MLDDYPMAGPADIAFIDFASILDENESPANLEARLMYDACLVEGVSPVTFLAFFNHESQYGKLGICADYDTKNPGNVRSPEDPSLGVIIDTRGGNFAKYPTWENGALDWGKRIIGPKYAGAGLTTVRGVLPKYAPTGDGNDPEAYIASVLGYVEAHGIPEVVADQVASLEATSPAARPIVEEDVSTGGNYWPTRQGHAARAIVLHITDGPTAQSAIGWFRNPTSDVSAHYVIDRDAAATIYRCLDEACAAWAQGVVESPDLSSPVVAGWVASGTNPNLEAVAIETAGFWEDGYTAEQVEAVGWLVGDICRRQGIPIDRDHILGHYQISGVQRANCPSLTDDQWATVLALAGGATTTNGPYATANESFDAYLAKEGEVAVWSGQIVGRGHWFGRDPLELCRTDANALLAYDGGYARDATPLALDDWESQTKAAGQLTIWGEAPPDPPDPQPEGPVGAAWPINPGDGLTGLPPTITFIWGTDAPTVDVSVYAETGDRVFGRDGTSATEVDVALPGPGAYEWAVRGRDGERTSDWTLARFSVAEEAPEPEEPDEPKPPSTEPYPPVVTPTHQEQPHAQTWRNVHDGLVDLAVSRRWRPDCEGGAGPWPDTAQYLEDDYAGAETLVSPTELRALVRRLSIHPPIVEAAYRQGLWERVPATYTVDGSEWEDEAATDYGEDWSDMPAHAQTWASQVSTLATAIQQHPTIAAAVASLGFSQAEAEAWAARYHCLRRRVRDLSEVAGC